MHKIIDVVVVDSKDALSTSTSTTDFVVKLPVSPLDVGEYHFLKFCIPLSMDNVTASNNGYEIDDVAGSIDVGQYNVGTLASWMTANIAGYTISWDDNARFTITNDSSTNFKWEPLETATILGFTQASYTGASSYTAEELPNMMPTRYITVHSKYIHAKSKNNTIHTDNRSDMITIIPVDKSLGNLLVHVPEDPLITNVESSNNDIIDFQFKDDQGNVLDLQEQNVMMVIGRHPKRK